MPFKVTEKIDPITHVASPVFTRYTRLPLITRTSSLPLGEVSCLGLDGAGSRKFAMANFTPFRGSFEAILPFFWWSKRRWDYPGFVIRSLPSFSGHTRRCGELLVATRRTQPWFWRPTPSNRRSGTRRNLTALYEIIFIQQSHSTVQCWPTADLNPSRAAIASRDYRL